MNEIFRGDKKVIFELPADESEFWYKDADDLFEKTRGNGSWAHFDPHSENPDHHWCEIVSGSIDLTGNWVYICSSPPIISDDGDKTWGGELYKAHYTDVQNLLENGGKIEFEWAAKVSPLFDLDEKGDAVWRE